MTAFGPKRTIARAALFKRLIPAGRIGSRKEMTHNLLLSGVVPPGGGSETRNRKPRCMAIQRNVHSPRTSDAVQWRLDDAETAPSRHPPITSDREIQNAVHDFSLRRRIRASPAKPNPNIAMVIGSGTGTGVAAGGDAKVPLSETSPPAPPV
jgi:hypothetical protein